MNSSVDGSLGDTKVIIKSIVIANPDGVSLKKLCNEYKELEGEEIPYRKLGFDNLTALLKSMPDMVRPLFSGDSVTLYPVVDDTTGHIIQMVAHQSKRRLKPKCSKSFGGRQKTPLRRSLRTSFGNSSKAPLRTTTSVKSTLKPSIKSRLGVRVDTKAPPKPSLRTPVKSPITTSQKTPQSAPQQRKLPLVQPSNRLQSFTPNRPQTSAPNPPQNSFKRPLNTSERMDPRIAKRLNANKDEDQKTTTITISTDDKTSTNVAPQRPTQTVTPSKPFHEMATEEVEALVSAVRETSSVISSVTTALEKSKSGIDSQLWSKIFSVEKVTDLKTLSTDTTGMLAAKTCLRQPLKIGEYSLKISARSDNRLFIPDASELKYLHMPPAISAISLDLNHGYEMVSDIHWGKPSNAKIDELLTWILKNRKKFMVNGELVPKELHTDFVCYRGVLAKLMTTPYENSERWVICATKYKGTIYLCQFHEEYPPPDDYFNKMSFGGYRFEHYLTSYEPQFPPDPNDFDPDRHEYCAVMRTRVMSENTSHSMVFGAELDCVLPNVREQPGTLSNFVELKTTKVMAKEFQYRNFLKYKLLKWWAQSYMVGVPTIYCGYKDAKNMVKEVEPLKIDSFPDLCVEFWSANVCLNFLNKFLHHLKEMVTIDDPNVVYQFAFQPQHDITCTRLVEPGDFQILPDWYIHEFSY